MRDRPLQVLDLGRLLVKYARLTTIVKDLGDLSAAVLLYRMMYWQEKTKAHFVVSQEGRVWVVQTADWWRDQTGLTRHQYDRALRVLRSTGKVSVKHGPFPGERFGRVSYVSPEPLRTGDRVPTKPDDPLSALPESPIREREEESNLPSEDIEHTHGGPKVEYEAIGGKKHKSLPKSALLVRRWQEAVAEVLPGAFLGSLTAPPNLVRKMDLFLRHVDPEVAEKRLMAIAKNWGVWRAFVLKASTMKKVPDIPNLKFLLQFPDLFLMYPIEEDVDDA